MKTQKQMELEKHKINLLKFINSLDKEQEEMFVKFRTEIIKYKNDVLLMKSMNKEELNYGDVIELTELLFAL